MVFVFRELLLRFILNLQIEKLLDYYVKLLLLIATLSAGMLSRVNRKQPRSFLLELKGHQDFAFGTDGMLKVLTLEYGDQIMSSRITQTWG